MATDARLTLHLELQAGTNAHHMIEACFKAFARALRAGRRHRPDETGVPSTKGTRLTLIAHRSTTGWATGAASRRRSTTSAPSPRHRRPRRAARGGRRSSSPGVGAFPEAMRRGGARPRRLLREQAGRRRARPRLCLGMQLLLERSTEHEGAAGLGLLRRPAGRGRGAPRSSRTSAGTSCLPARSRLTAGLGEGRPSTTCTPSSAGRRSRGTSSAGRVRRAVLLVVERGIVSGAQFHPEKSSRDGLALLATSHGLRARSPA